ncbi:MAG: BamA/TamA family outer membrane protein [Ferruginibacter sp.]|nr:BamA/TamA family outer membrane protein [Ferruginibacter sp.]
MKNIIFISALFLIFIASSCSVRKYLPAGERLYKGASVKIEKDSATAGSARSLKKKVSLAASPKPNKFLLGQPYKVWFWYKIGEPKREKGLKALLRNRLGEPPVLSSRVNAKATAENMASLMDNLGYFHTTVQGDTTHTGSYFLKANYTAQVKPQYKFGAIKWVGDSTPLLKMLERDATTRGLLKTGNPYRLSDITTERDRLDLFAKTMGYYYFNPDYLMAYADSTVGARKVDLYLNIKKTTPENAKFSYKINSITVFPNYSLASADLDTSKRGVEFFDGLSIKDTIKNFKKNLFAQNITYRPGSVYSSRQQNTTLNRLINLGAFKFVKNRFEEVKPVNKDDTSHLLNVYYYLTPAKKKSLQAEVDGFTKENDFLGTQLSINWLNRNAFKGAEQLKVKAYGGIETSSNDSIKISNYRIGTEVTLKLPRYAIPFFKIKENFFYPPNTSLLLGYELFKQNIFYLKNLFRFQYEFTWKPNLETQYTIAPVSLSYLQASNITDSFQKQIVANPSLLLSVYSESVLASFASYTYNSGFKQGKNKVYFNTSVELSGNIAGLITGAKDFRSKNIFGVPFSQYAKVDFNYHFTRKLTNKFEWANRLQVGVGLPYNNSRLLPFNKLYTIGGSNSIRGFRTRTLGPGTYKPTPGDQRFFQIIGGDYKLLGNTELRIPFTPQLSGALFIDAGNVWTKDTLLFGTQGKLTPQFLKELAVASGFGIRFDATVLLIRADLGIPVRKPYLPDGQRWVLDQIDFSSRAWRKENLILNIAIGLPF